MSARRPMRVLALAALAGALALATGAADAPPGAPETTTDAKQAYMEGVRLARENRCLASVPWFRRARALRPDLWQVHADLSSALSNASLEPRPLFDGSVPAVRTSRERVAMWREAFAALDEAAARAPGPHERAYVEELRAQNDATWGLGLDAMVAYSVAVEIDPSSVARARAAGGYLAVLRNPAGR